MIYSNLAGTTSNIFKVGSNSNGQILSNNAYDFFWNTPDPISGAQNLNIRTLGPGDNIFDLKDVGQYCCTSDEAANQILNMPKQTGNLAFLLLIEPSIGYNTQYLKYTMRFRNGEMWTCERIDNTTFIAWERYAWANEIPVMPSLHAVAISGDYNSLANKPNIPSPFDASWTPTVWSGTVTNSKCYCYRHDKLLFLSGEFEVQRSNSSISLDIEGMPFNINPVAPCVGNGTVEYTGTLYENVSKVIQIYPYVRQQSLSFYAQLNGDGRLSVYDIGPLLETNGPIYVTFSVTCFAFS